MNRKISHSLLLGVLAGASVQAASLMPSLGYQVGEVLSSQTLSAFDIYDDAGARAYGWDANSSTLRQYDVANGGVLADYGAPPGGYADAAFISFVRRSPDGQSVWVGYTVGGNADDRIYEVTNLSGAAVWNQRTTLAGVYDLQFSANGSPFASANLGGFGNPNKLFFLNPGDNFSAIEFAETGGFSADLAFDVTGALIYATTGVGAEQLVRFSQGDINAFLSDPLTWSPLDLVDATVLSDLIAGGSGIFADAFGNIFISLTDYSTFNGSLVHWNGVVGAGDNTQLVASVSNSLGELDGLGDLYAGGELFQSVGFLESGLDTVMTPEPGQYAMMAGVLALGLVVWRRRR